MSTTRPLADELDTSSPELSGVQLEELFFEPALSLAKRIERVCGQWLVYAAAVDQILTGVRCSGPTTAPQLAATLAQAYHRANTELPDDVANALSAARTQRGQVSASLTGIRTAAAPTAVDLLQILHWKVHNLLVLIAGPAGRGTAIHQGPLGGQPSSDPIHIPEGFDTDALARWLIRGKSKVLPVLAEWRETVERIAAEVVWEQRSALAATLATTGVPTALPRSRAGVVTPSQNTRRKRKAPVKTNGELQLLDYLAKVIPAEGFAGSGLGKWANGNPDGQGRKPPAGFTGSLMNLMEKADEQWPAPGQATAEKKAAAKVWAALAAKVVRHRQRTAHYA